MTDTEQQLREALADSLALIKQFERLINWKEGVLPVIAKAEAALAAPPSIEEPRPESYDVASAIWALAMRCYHSDLPMGDWQRSLREILQPKAAEHCPVCHVTGGCQHTHPAMPAAEPPRPPVPVNLSEIARTGIVPAPSAAPEPPQPDETLDAADLVLKPHRHYHYEGMNECYCCDGICKCMTEGFTGEPKKEREP